jgi:Flp pilus assembly protein TadD
MTNFNALKLVASTLAIGAGFATGAIAGDSGQETASEAQAKMMKVAGSAAAVAKKAMANGKMELAVEQAEKAVAAMPQDPSYRTLLGDVYLSAGRFASAKQSFSDALALDEGNGRAALKLALALSAEGEKAEALQVLGANRDRIDAADYGLALVLAGDAGSALPVLEEAARGPNSSAKVRQNLAFAHAMSNNWALARTIAAQDLSADLVTKRIMEWSTLSRAREPHVQVATILGIKPAFDPGQPQSLALGTVAPGASMLAAVEAPVTETEVAAAAPAVSVPLPVEAAEPVQVPVAAQPVLVAAAPVAEVPLEQRIVFAPRSAVVQPLPASYRQTNAPRAAAAKQVVVPAKTAAAAAVPARAVEAGRYVVQLGAYSSPQRAEQGWNRLTGKLNELKGYDPQSARVRVKTASFYRLSVSGFTTKDDAGRVCSKIRASGGDCFIRATAGDAPLAYALRNFKGGTRIASARR